MGNLVLNGQTVFTQTGTSPVEETTNIRRPNAPGCYCRGYNTYTQTAVTTNHGNYNIWTYDEIEYNIGNHFDNDTGYFTAPYDGRYLISGNSGYKASEGYGGFGIVKNGDTALFVQWSASVTNLNHAYNGGTLVCHLYEGDYIGVGHNASYIGPHSSTFYVAFSVYFLG